ncbi:adenosine 3'-phospho 5'-phosphosulfate transporter 1-like isoform X2 [Dendronephthya gigantea]|uniref:adenosine 3'-phospho 5'-phosphosulfate transporter 1-like isoform X2 n=1 Tax=Dendronephthya gigantea TaxID=151771 RepID=UPI00106D9AFA|nr:adenosine 3'-phospho 5'-phosphosulfate transporter 1-like isoform X2 [Dendronephthya gigantea]
MVHRVILEFTGLRDCYHSWGRYYSFGRGFPFKLLQAFVYGQPEEKRSIEEGPIRTAPESKEPPKLGVTTAKLIFCAIGLQGSYLTWGVLQEQIMTETYDELSEDGILHKVKFEDSQYLVFSNRVLALIVAGVYISIAEQPYHTAPFFKYSYSSFSNIMSSWCQYEALKFVSFPTQVLCKASKMIPVMIMGKVVSGKSYPYSEYLVAILLSFGTSLFLLSHNADHAHHDQPTTVVGLFILLGYMIFDSFTSNWQSALFKKHKMSSMQMMFGTNVFSSVFTFCSLLQTGGLVRSLSFTSRHPRFLYQVFILSMTSAFGQLFIFYTIQTFGPIVFVIIMTARMIFSIVLSCIIYKHTLASQAIFGVFVVFGAISYRIYVRYKASKGTDKVSITQNK